MRSSALVVAALVWIFVGPYGAGPRARSSSTPAAPAAGLQQTRAEGSRTKSPLRQLRGMTLMLLGRTPTEQELDRVAAAPSPADAERVISTAVDEALASPEFARRMVQLGHEYIGVTSYDIGVNNGQFVSGQAIGLTQCAVSSTHAGAWGVFNKGYPQFGDEPSLCDDAAAPTIDVEPWWAPGTQVQTIGRIGSGRRRHNGRDCGVARVTLYGNTFNDDSQNPGCSCGPNLVYCKPIDDESSNHQPHSQRRMAFEEPARLFAHIVNTDRPLTDLVLGDYTVVTQKLQHMYVRAARQHSATAALDDDQWWKNADQLAWREVPFARMHPLLLASRTYTFDPRRDRGEPSGIPSAGVLTTLSGLASFPRERVRAARWLERFACVSFVPPPPEVHYAPFRRDPASEGTCQHCHQSIDPAAIHFKRIGFGSPSMVFGGIGPWRWDVACEDGRGIKNCEPFSRWAGSFQPDTRMTPVASRQFERNPDARFIDFLPPDQKLFGLTSDGTIGPLGFAKMLVASGEFDRCASRRLYEHVTGFPVDPMTDGVLLDELRSTFVALGRRVRPFIKHLTTLPVMKEGW